MDNIELTSITNDIVINKKLGICNYINRNVIMEYEPLFFNNCLYNGEFIGNTININSELITRYCQYILDNFNKILNKLFDKSILKYINNYSLTEDYIYIIDYDTSNKGEYNLDVKLGDIIYKITIIIYNIYRNDIKSVLLNRIKICYHEKNKHYKKI